MASSKIPLKSKGFDEIILWIVVGLFLALGLAWVTYPRIYLHYHPGLAWPVIPQRWREYSDSSPTLVYFFLATMTAAFGLWQTRFCRRFGRDSSQILSWLYLLFSLVFVAGSWTFDLGSHFWTIPIQNEFYPPDRVLEVGRILVKWGVYSTLGAAFLNVTYSSFRRVEQTLTPWHALGWMARTILRRIWVAHTSVLRVGPLTLPFSCSSPVRRSHSPRFSCR